MRGEDITSRRPWSRYQRSCMQILEDIDVGRKTEEDLNPLFPGPVFQVQYPEYPADTTPFNICSHCRWLSFQANKLPTERHNEKMYEDCRSVSDNQSRTVLNNRITVPPFDSFFNDTNFFLVWQAPGNGRSAYNIYAYISILCIYNSVREKENKILVYLSLKSRVCFWHYVEKYMHYIYMQTSCLYLRDKMWRVFLVLARNLRHSIFTF